MNNSTSKEELFTSVPVKKAVISLAVPTVIGQIITVVYNMADTFFIGQLGDHNQVAAATIAMPAFMFLTALANLFGIGGASLISRCLGAGNRERAKHASAYCIWSAIGTAFLFGFTITLFRNRLLPLLGTNTDTFDFCSSYIFWTIGIGAVPTVLNTCLAHLIRSEGYSSQASFGVAFGGILNIIIDPVFIFLFKMEITGAAIATMLSNVAATIYFIAFLFRIRKDTTITPSPKYCSLKDGIPTEVLTIGFPSCVISIMGTLSNLTLNKIIAGYSNEAVAGMGIAKKIDLLAFAIAQGMGQGTLPLIGYNYSAGNRNRMQSAIKVLLIDCLAVSLVGMALMFFGATPITRCFIDDAVTVEYSKTFLRIVCLACPTTALNFLAITLFQATGKKIQPLVLSLLRKGGLDIPLMLLFNSTIGIKGIAWATPLADTLALMVSAALILPYLRTIMDPHAASE